MFKLLVILFVIKLYAHINIFSVNIFVFIVLVIYAIVLLFFILIIATIIVRIDNITNIVITYTLNIFMIIN